MPRAAVFVPSKKYKEYQLVVSTLSRSTSRMKYIRYWGAIERMFELILSVRVLAQLLERRSYSLLGETAKEMHKIRNEMLKRDIKINTEKLSELILSAADLQRLSSLCQGLSDPHVWSRAEYSILKAKSLIEELGIYVSLEHIKRNIDAINQFGDHLDELYLADLAENNNKISIASSTLLAGVSFILTILILPSFWADIKNISLLDIPRFLYLDLGLSLTKIKDIGTLLAFVLIIISSLLVFSSLYQIVFGLSIREALIKKIRKNISNDE
jgi:hypothetical protein